MRIAYQDAGLVHADLSEYNILYYLKKPVIIDVGQAVLTEHMNAREFLRRDIDNVNRYFRNLDVDIMDKEEVFLVVTGAPK
jgi:RIO kinase 1